MKYFHEFIKYCDNHCHANATCQNCEVCKCKMFWGGLLSIVHLAKYEVYKEYRNHEEQEKEVGSPSIAITIIND